MSHELPLGKIIETPQQRDAVHIAVAPVIAAERLVPGGHIGFVGGDTEHVTARAKVLLGVVDPFLTDIIERGQQCWMFLYPQTITSLRHDWTHPAFEASVTSTESEQWLRAFCASNDCPNYEVVMEALSGVDPSTVDSVYDGWGYITDEFIHFDGRDAHSDIPAEFWKHAENVLGPKLIKQRPSSFSCSC